MIRSESQPQRTKEKMAGDMHIHSSFTKEAQKPDSFSFPAHVSRQSLTAPERGPPQTTGSSQNFDPDLNPIQVAQAESRAPVFSVLREIF